MDNCSDNDEASVIEKYCSVIRAEKNYGFAGNNLGICDSLSDDYVILLNSDTIVDSRLISEMVKTAESNSLIGVVGVKTYILECPDRLQAVWWDTDCFPFCRPAGLGEIDRGQYDQNREVNLVHGACFLVKREVFSRIGLLNSSYFLYNMEFDFFTRARRAGYKVIYSFKAKVWHKNSSYLDEFAKDKFQYKEKSKIDSFTVYLVTKNAFLFAKSNLSFWRYFGYVLSYLLIRVWYKIFWLSRIDYHLIPFLFFGIRDGIKFR